MDFTNKKNELNLVKRTAKIFLQNSILMKITGEKLSYLWTIILMLRFV